MKNIDKIYPIVGSILAAIVFCLLFAYNVNPFLYNNGGDSAIFQQLGLAILKGKKVYVDIFDHKGFILFLIQALGQYISPGHLGLFILMVINLAVTFLFWYKTARLYLDRWTAIIPVIVACGLYALTIQKGNLSECWSLPYISGVLYLIVRYLRLKKPFTLIECFLVGCCIGIITFIRLNNMAAICAVCMLMLISYLRESQYLKLLYSILSVLAGAVFVAVCTSIVYVMLSGWSNLYELYYGTFIYNFRYFANFGNGSILQLPFYISVAVFLLEIICNYREKNNSLLYTSLTCYVFTFLLMGKAYFSHYFILTAPIIVISMIDILKSPLYARIRYKKIIFAGISIIVILCSIIVFPSIKVRFERGICYERAMPALLDKVNKIPEVEKDSIWNYSDGINLLQSCGIVQCNKIVLRSHLNKDSHLSEPKELQDYRPCWIVLNEDFKWNDSTRQDSLFISKNYSLRIRTHGFNTTHDSEKLFYQRNDLANPKQNATEQNF